MPDQVVPITGLDQTGVILDTPPVALPPNAFTNAKNVRFKDGAVRKMEGEVDIFEGMIEFFSQTGIGALQYIAWWPSPNQTTDDRGYYIFVIENNTDPNNVVHDIYAMLPGAEFDMAAPTSRDMHYHRLGTGYNRNGKWQHTLFNGGFTFIINNGQERPLYVTDAEGNTDITQLSLSDLPGWDSYRVNELLLRDTFTDTSSNIFDTGQLRVTGETNYVVERTRSGAETTLIEDTNYTITQANGQDVITFGTGVLQTGDEVIIRFQSTMPVNVSAAIVRAFGDFLVAGNLEEYRDVTSVTGVVTRQIIRRLTGVVRTSDVAQPGAIPNNWNPFAAGTSTADEFVIADTGTVQDMVALQGNMYLYTNTSISAMRLTGNATVPLTVQPVTDQYGALTTDAVLEYDGKHFVIGSDDIYLFGGHPGSIQSISDQKVRRSFFNRVNPINENTANLFTLRYAARDEIWICYPTLDSAGGEADEAYIWNYRNGTWTIRTLNSVVRGDVGPIPGGGVPSAVIRFSGQSGTDDVVQVGSREVQTIQVETTAMVGHASDTSRPEEYAYSTLNTDANNVARPALTLDAPELVEVEIGPDFYSGPNPAMQEYNIRNVPAIRTGGFASGGARFRIEYTTSTANTGNDNTMVTVHANELNLPGTGDRDITGTQYATALATHLNGLTEFDNWTITSSGTTINLISDYAGMRELIGFDITTFTATVENLMPSPNLFSGAGPHVFNDSFGDELFTVTRTGTSAPYTFDVTTSRDTGFQTSNDITQLAFITDGETFAAPDPFNGESGTFTFMSTSGEFALRTVPPANFVDLVREMDRIPDNGVINTETTNEDGVNIVRRAVQGGYTRESTDSMTPRNDVNEGVTVAVTDTMSTASFNTAVLGNSSSVVDGGGFSYSSANALRYTNSFSGSSVNPRAWRTNDRTRVVSSCTANNIGDNACTSFQGATGWSPPTSPGNDVLLNDWNHSAGSGAKTVITSWDTGRSVPNPAQSGEMIQIIYGGFGIEYANGVRLFYATSSTNPTNNEFSGFSRQGANRLMGGTISTHTGTVRIIIRGDETAVVNSRRFTVTNSNPFAISFSQQGSTTSTTVAARVGMTDGSEVINGTPGSTDESWTWVNQAISLSGNSIGGSGTQDLTGSTGRRETSGSGVTVVSQNTASPQTTMTGTAPEMAVILPSTNGNSISNPMTATYNPTQQFQFINWTGRNSSSLLSAYRLSNGTRISGGAPFLNRDSNNAPNGWTSGFESGRLANPPIITASNMPNPVDIGTAVATGTVGDLNQNSQESQCLNLRGATATASSSRFPPIAGVRQSGTSGSQGPAVGLTTRNAQVGSPWSGFGGTCGARQPHQASFSNSINVFNTPSTFATNLRIVLQGPSVTTTVTVPRSSSETYTVTNNNPFPITFSAGTINESVAADSTSTFTANQEGVSWSVSTPTTTNYQFVLTNNNQRPLISGTLTHDTSTRDLAGLGVGQSVTTAFSTETTAVASFIREVEQAGSMTVTTPADLMLMRSGIGTVPTDPANLEPVMFNFGIDFADDTPDISVSYTTPENRDPSGASNLTNEGAVTGYVRALLSDAEFNRYFIVHTRNTITQGSASSMDDSELAANVFRVEARAAPGNLIPGTSITMPAHDALSFDVPLNQMNGGDADQTIRSIRRGTSTTNDPIAITLETGTRVPQPDGTFMPNTASTHGIVLNGSYPAGTAGGTAITEVIRDHLRLDDSFDMLWRSDTTVADSPTLMYTSDNNGPHHITVAGVSPSDSGLLPTHLNFRSTQQGITTTENPRYPEITLTPPLGETGLPFNIMLNPLATDMSTDRLSNTDITNIIRERFSYSGWTVISGIDSNIGNAPSANQIRIVKDDEGEVNSGMDQMSGWRVTNITYGNTGRTLPGTVQPTDGSVVGRLNTTDFVRADSAGPVTDANPLITAVGMGDNLDFRGSRTERSQPTRIMVQITNPDIDSMDPIFDQDNNLVRDEMGNVQLQTGNTQYLAFIFGTERGTYNPVNQEGTQPGTRRDATFITNAIESRIISSNRRVQVNRTTDGSGLTIIPTQFSGLANFIVDVFLNDSRDNVDRWNAIIAANSTDQSGLVGFAIDTSNNMGIQSTVPAPVDSGTDQQFNPGNRVPNFASRNIITTGLVSNASIINNDFDPLRPWPTTQVNLNREYPIFATTEVNDAGTITRQHFRGADIGFLFLGESYESFVERIEMAITPEFDTEQIQSLALWGDGGSQVTFGQPIEQATLNIRMYGSNAPGSTLGRYTPGMNGEATNNYIIGDDYKIDMRIHGRFLNVRISDMIPTTDNSNPNLATDTGLNVPRGISWNVSGMQADIVKGGRR